MKLYVVVEVSPDESDFPIYCHEDIKHKFGSSIHQMHENYTGTMCMPHSFGYAVARANIATCELCKKLVDQKKASEWMKANARWILPMSASEEALQ